MPRPNQRRGEPVGRVKGIPWTKPASAILPDAPPGLLLWEYAETQPWKDFVDELAAARPEWTCTVRNVVGVVQRHKGKRDDGFVPRPTPADANAWAPPPKSKVPADMDVFGALAGESGAVLPEPEPEAAPVEHAAYKSDPVLWCKERHVKIDNKAYGLVPFVPYEWQEDVMRRFWEGGTYFVEKSRQEGFSTCILVAGAHALLYSQEVLGTPLTMPIVGDKEGTALNLLKIVKTVLHYAELTDEERARLSKFTPESGTKRVSYITEQGTSWIEAYTSTGSAARSYAFNAALLEEFAWSDKAPAIWASVRPVVRDVPRPRVWVVSTPNGPSFHADLCDDADDYGAIYLPMDWRIRPERDQAWRDARTQELGEDLAAQECDLKRLGSGDALVNITSVAAHAQAKPWLGGRPLAGHLYCKALDTSGPGQDKDVFTVVDITPGQASQVVLSLELPHVGNEIKLKRILQLHAEWPGNLYIDGTNDATFPERVSNRARHVVAIRFRGAQEEVQRVDHAARLHWRSIERQQMSSSFKDALEFGDLLLHKEHFPKLWEAVTSAHFARVREKDDRIEHSQRAKRRGKYPDYWDSAMMAALDVRPQVRRKNRAAPTPRGVRADGPGEKLREMHQRERVTPRSGGNWRGRKY